MKTIILVITSLIISNCLFAQKSLKTLDEISKHADAVMEEFKKKEFEKAYALLEEYWPMDEYEIFTQEATTVDDLNIVMGESGDIVGVEFIEDEKVKDFLLRRTYVVLLERQITRVFVIYYKNRDGWMVNQFKWDENVDDIFK